MKIEFHGQFSAISIIETVDGIPHREARSPGADITDLPKDVQAKIRAVWTPELIAEWEADKAARLEAETEPEPTKWRIRTYVIISRLQAIDARDETSLFLACHAVLKDNADFERRWNSVDAMGGVLHDDSRMIGALQDLGATEAQITEILAPEGQSPREGE